YLFCTLICLCLFLLDGYTFQYLNDCNFSGDDVEGVVFAQSYVFNQEEVIHFDTNIKKYVGRTEYGVSNAEEWNKDTAQIAVLVAEKDRYCKHNVNVFRNGTLDRRVAPTVWVGSSKPVGSKTPNVLVCYASGFYPPQITVSWLRNGEEVKGITSSEMLPGGDWTYQVHVYLETPTQSGEKYTCRVQHSSLRSPIEVDWDYSMPESDRNKVIIGASGLVLGLVIALAGGVFYRKKKSAGTEMYTYSLLQGV
ncbi:HB2C protein, partial [Amia calva]|nr:HB2C protein [Amia calva]